MKNCSTKPILREKRRIALPGLLNKRQEELVSKEGPWSPRAEKTKFHRITVLYGRHFFSGLNLNKKYKGTGHISAPGKRGWTFLPLESGVGHFCPWEAGWDISAPGKWGETVLPLESEVGYIYQKNLVSHGLDLARLSPGIS